MNDVDLDRVRRAALDRIETSRRHARGMLIAGAVFEGVALVLILLTADFGDLTHRLIFFCAVLVYAPLAFGLFALRAYIDLSVQRILKAVELVGVGGADT